MAQCGAPVESLFQPSGQSGHGSPLIALDGDDPAFEQRCKGQARAFLLCKAWGLRHRFGALGKWARECLRGDDPLANEPTHCAALIADAPSAAPAPVSVPA